MTGEGSTPDGPLTLVEVAHLSDIGRVRHHNEDRSLVGGDLLVVADGMGGANAGEVAAQMAVDAVGALPAPVTVEVVRTAVIDANRAIRRLARDEPDKSGMGTTLTAALMRDHTLDLVHVGDSRAYLWRDGVLTQITDDHSVVAELVRRGSITAEEAESHPHRNVITRALGAEAEVDADTVTTEVRAGDVLLLCSDGLSSYVAHAAIAGVLAGAPSLSVAARELVAAANAAGGADNVTVVLARVGPASEPQSGDTLESLPLGTPPPEGGEPAAERRVLGGTHGHAGTDRPGAAPTGRPPRVLEPVGRRRSRLGPVLVGAAVLLAALAGAVAWVDSRYYTLEASPEGTVQVSHGIPWSLLGADLSSAWQDTGVPVAAVERAEPGAVSSTLRGQGQAVELAARLVWEHGVGQPPVISAPEPAPAPAPPGEGPATAPVPGPTAGTTTAP